MEVFNNILVRFTKIWEDFVEVQWKRQIFDGRKVTRFHMTAKAENYAVERYFEANQKEFRLPGLEPGWLIQVSIRMELESTSGLEWSEWTSQSATTLSTAKVLVMGIQPAALHGTVSWGLSDLLTSGPTATAVALPAAKFQIKVEQRGRLFTHGVRELDYIPTQPFGGDFTIDDVEPNGTFFVQLRAVSAFGDFGRWCTPTKFLTLQPVAMDVINVAETEVTLEWGRGDGDDSTMTDSKIDELVVVVEQIPDQHELDLDANASNHRVDAQVFGNEVRSYRVKGLLPGRKYVLRSRYRNTLGNHSEWQLTPFRTLFAVAPIDVMLVGHNFIQVKWARELPLDAPAFMASESVAEWEVRCRVGSASTSTRLPASEMETKLMNLMHGVDYVVDVRAITTAGKVGNWSPSVAVTTLHRLVPRVTVAGESWLQVAWDRKEKRYQDNIERYHIQLNCMTSPFRLAKYFPATATSFCFESLKPDTEYVIMIQAYSDERWGPWSEPVSTRTCQPCIPILVRRGEDFVQARWECEYYKRSSIDASQQIYQVKVAKASADAVDSGEASVAPTESVQFDLQTAAHRFNHLAAFSRIIVQIRAFDYALQCWCDWGPPTEFRTLPAVIVVVRMGETYAELSWPRRPQLLSAVTDTQSAAGVLDPLSPDPAKQYVLRINKVDSNKVHREVAKHHFDSAQATSFSVTELKSDSVYSAQLSFLDIHDRWSSDSSPVCFRTLPQLNIAVRDVGEGYAALRWGRWADGVTLLSSQPDDADASFRIQVTRMLSANESMFNESEPIPAQYNVQGKSAYIVTDLLPNSLYRVNIASAPNNSQVWGDWSDPVYIYTTRALTAALDMIGQDFAVVSWGRDDVTRPEILKQLKTPELRQANYSNKQPLPAQPMDVDGGTVVFYGDDTVTEHHVQIYRVDPPSQPALDPKPITTLIFDAKRNPNDCVARVANLVPNTMYRAVVRSMYASKQWGVWSEPMEFRTTMPTKIRVEKIEQEGILIGWASLESENGDALSAVVSRAADADKEKHELAVEGVDDTFTLNQVVPAEQHSLLVQGLRPNATYSFTVRSFLRSENAWGAWCDKIFVSLTTCALQLAEASQQWLHLRWSNKAPPDGRPKAQFLTVLGDGKARVITLGPAVNSHVVADLETNAMYSAHLLIVEQKPAHWVPEANTQANVPNKAGHNPRAHSDSVGAKVVSFSMPMVASETSRYVHEGLQLRTHRKLEARIERVGQNFVLIRWGVQKEDHEEAAPSHVPGEVFEIETVAIDGDEPPRYLKTQGTYAFIRHLKPDTEVRCAVRCVAGRTEADCMWSNACTVRLLPMIDPVLGPGDGSDVPGVGEDYVIVNWSRALGKFTAERLQGVSFEVRLTPLEGPNAHVEQTFETAQPKYHCKSLLPDTKYQLQVRTVIAHKAGETDEVARGEWSAPLITTTLSPMAVAISHVNENSAVVHWRRKNCAVTEQWWCDFDPETLRQEIMTISSFHIRVIDPSVTDPTSSNATVYDEQFGEQHAEFQRCAVNLKSLRPNSVYHVTLRASTGMLWGGWSTIAAFRTTSPVQVQTKSSTESTVVVSWTASSLAVENVTAPGGAPISLALVSKWELSFKPLGPDAATGAVIAAVGESFTQQCIGGLTANTPYSVAVRAKYNDDVGFGPWSEPSYCVTLPAVKVEVGKVGETFVHVAWSREPQQTIASKLRAKHLESERALDNQLRELDDERLKIVGESPATMTSGEAARDPSRAAVDKEARLAAVERAIQAVQAKAQQSKKLLSHHISELERSATYAKGDDLRYELVVYFGAFARGHDENMEPQVLLRKRLGRGEDSYRLENLTPKTAYFVIVRALHVSVSGHVSATFRHNVADADEETQAPWGEWSAKTHFTTLKPITIKSHGIGSTSFSVEWDTGIDNSASSSKTAISKFQIKTVDVKRQQPALPDIILNDPSLKGHVVQGFQPSSLYSISVRVCYEGDKWGVWSAPVQFCTLPSLIAKLEMTGERQIDFLVWRDVLPAVEPDTVVWTQPTTEHQLSINDVPCDDTFAIEDQTSTQLTLDALSLDTEYAIGIRDKVDGVWQEFTRALVSETLPHLPSRPTLVERKGTNVVVAWEHKRSLPSKQYLYKVELALLSDDRKSKKSEAGPFETLGFTTDQSFRLDLPFPIHCCLFRVSVAKTNMTFDGTPMYVAGFVPGKPHPAVGPVVVENPHLYSWSGTSPVAHFKTPSVPDHPTGIHVRDLTHNSALVKWQKPANHAEHTGLIYRVYLNNSYQDRFECIAETTETLFALSDLVPNMHYRVAITAESTMGRSINNNTLHFSTRGMPTSETFVQTKPMTSTLPPRTVLRPPAAFIRDVAKHKKLVTAEGVGDMLIDDAGSTIHALQLNRAATAPAARTSPERSRQVTQKVHRQLPPLPSDKRAL